MKLVKANSQTHKLALRRENICVLAPHRLASVAGGQRHLGVQHEPDIPTVSYDSCDQDAASRSYRP